MDTKHRSSSSSVRVNMMNNSMKMSANDEISTIIDHPHEEEEGDELADMKRGPWSVEEDVTLMNYITKHGDGRWNSLARSAGLKRNGKSCRLRWLNYLHPDVRRGNITLEEQLLILELHSRWGNRWSKIAQYLPGRTDNEIKNYWRTRVQKHAKQLKCDVNSKQFKDAMRYLWMPRLVERIQAEAINTHKFSSSENYGNTDGIIATMDNYHTAASSESFESTPISDLTDNNYRANDSVFYPVNHDQNNNRDSFDYLDHGLDFQAMDQTSIDNNNQWFDQLGDTSDSFWNVDDNWFLM